MNVSRGPASRRLPLRKLSSPCGDFTCRHFLVFADGAVKPSPYGWAGIGFAVFTDDGRFVMAKAWESKYPRRMGINKVEMWAAIRALSQVRQAFGASGVALHSDSAWLVRVINGYAQPKRPDVVRLFQILCDVREDHRWVTATKIPRSHPKMAFPDKYSKEGAALSRQRALRQRSGLRWVKTMARPVSRDYDARRSKERDV